MHKQDANPAEPRHAQSGTSGPDVSKDLLTVEEVALRLKVSGEHVRALIRTRRLKAVDLAIGKKRPLYRLRLDVVEQFLEDSTQSSRREVKRTRFKRLPPVVDHFPQLR